MLQCGCESFHDGFARSKSLLDKVGFSKIKKRKNIQRKNKIEQKNHEFKESTNKTSPRQTDLLGKC